MKHTVVPVSTDSYRVAYNTSYCRPSNWQPKLTICQLNIIITTVTQPRPVYYSHEQKFKTTFRKRRVSLGYFACFCISQIFLLRYIRLYKLVLLIVVHFLSILTSVLIYWLIALKLIFVGLKWARKSL